ncbi:glycosyltransferase [Vibrio mexicanus]|uniref:glycosyltransferase n=1 Tax=Vibrio mexicanus TaxID=1004326 RepID=UPI0012F95C04|nr:glycosyltransferase [Vibrio mexicanus]
MAEYHLPQERESLIAALQRLQVSKMHIHHSLEFDKSIWDLPKELGVTYDVTLHDYYSVCPRANLVDESEVYCGEPSLNACNRCIKKNGVHESSLLQFEDLGGSITSWREFYEDKLQRASNVFTPSHDTKDRILRYLDLNNIQAKYHPEPDFDYQPKSLENVKILNITFIGAIGPHKGINVLKKYAKHAYKFDLPVKFTVIGYTSDDDFFNDLPNVTITGEYNREELNDLIVKHECHVAGLFSVWPETYSYTLSEAMRNNLHVACFDLGAIPERLDSSLILDHKNLSTVLNMHEFYLEKRGW